MSRQQPWKSRREIPDPQIRDAADQFDAARRLLSAQPPGSGVLFPLVNATAVVIELYLKCLAAEKHHAPDTEVGLSRVHSKPSTKGHGLRHLYRAIDATTRRDMERSFASSRPTVNSPGIESLLERCEGAFEVSRYPFEPDADPSTLDLESLIAVADFLSAFTRTYPPRETISW